MIAEIKPHVSDCDREMAQSLRELADGLEAGTIRDVVAVANLCEEGCYLRHSSFDDAWRLLGAIEYARNTVHLGMQHD